MKKFLHNVLFKEIVKALKLTFSHYFVKEVTLQYPHEKTQLPNTHRGALCLLRYDDNKERCVGCDLCEAACPSACIRVVSAESLQGGDVVRYATSFDIDITKCVFCGFCVEACPVNALAMTKMYEFSTHNKRTLIFNKAKLYEVGERHHHEAKAYLVAHDQEGEEETVSEYRYRFPYYQKPEPVAEPEKSN